MKIEIIPCLKDNYSYIIIDLKNNNTCVVDPSESKPIINFLEKNNLQLNYILKDLKMQITDIWKKENVIDLSIPLLIRIKFQHTNLRDLDNLKNTFYKISIIDNYSLEEFNINYSFFKIYYYGNPKRLRTELLKFGYQLNNDQGHWGLYIDD